MKMILKAILILLMLFILGCTSDDVGGVGGSGFFDYIDCPLNRPPPPIACTREYNPVCGLQSNGTSRTYTNGCSACADSRVVSYLMGTCP